MEIHCYVNMGQCVKLFLEYFFHWGEKKTTRIFSEIVKIVKNIRICKLVFFEQINVNLVTGSIFLTMLYLFVFLPIFLFIVIL